MKFKKFLSVILCTVIIAAAFMPNAYAESIYEEAEYVEGEIVISSSKEIEDSRGLIQTASDSDTVSIDFDDVGIEEIKEVETYSEEENVYLAEVDGSVEKICKELNQNKDIAAEPNYILHTCDFTMPREISGNLSMYANYQKWYYNDIMHIPEALQKHEVTGAGVTVAVIDDGFDINATDFPTNLWRNSSGTVGWNVYKKSDDISPIYKSDGSEFDNTSHGSNVAGIIGMPPNSKGGIGAAYGAELMLIQAANYSSDTSNPSFTNTSVTSAIDYARENGADIINLSLGSTSNVSAISSAVTRAVNAGIVVVAAAGNEGKSTSSQKFYPASLSNVIGVMAIDKDNPAKLSSFSNYDVSSGGQYYNIAAPGVAIFGCKNSSQYTLNNGTSQAAPLVAAACALYKEKYPNKTVAELRSDMLTSATETVTAYSSTSYKYKSLNVLKFLDYSDSEICTEHSWSAWTVVTPATCTEKGSEKRICSNCGENETRSTEALGHLYSSNTVSPTCEDYGYTIHICERCSDQYTDSYVSATGHTYTEEIVQPADCTNDGLKRFSCHCGDSYTEIIPAAGHSYIEETVEATCTQDGIKTYTCHCGDTYSEILPATGHNYSDWHITSYPSETASGISERECANCHETEYIELENAIVNCDCSENLLFGLKPGITAEEFILNNTVDGQFDISVSPSAGNSLGTDSEITVTYPSGYSITYSIVIFGDVTGDGWYDGTDSLIVSCLYSRMLSPSQVGDAVCLAADCNHDGDINRDDIELLELAGTLKTQIDQSKSTDELLSTSSAYSEYINLIEQTVKSETAETVEEETIDPQFSYSFLDSLIRFIKELIDFLKEAFVFIEKLF